MIAAINAVVVQ